MKIRCKALTGVGLLLSALTFGQAQAASYSYDLQLNNLGYSGDLVNVQWSDSAAGKVSFIVTALSPATWLQEFYFNLTGIAATSLSVPTINTGWSYDSTGKNISDYGFFDGGTFTNGNANRVSPLTFTITGVGLSAASFLDVSTEGSYFAAHIGWVDGFTGFAGGGEEVCGTVVSCNPDTNVPIPGAVWLFGSALGLLGWGKRRPKVVEDRSAVFA